jgi:acyl-ACP thioesterase
MTRTVAHEEIDLNGHLNNTHYLDWADGLMGEKTPTSLWVQYVKELMEGQEVTLRYELGEDGLYVRGSSVAAESFLLTAAF